MTKLGLWLRMKSVMHKMYTDELWTRWKVPFSSDKNFQVSHKEECDAIIGRIPTQYRDAFINFLEKKQMYLLRELPGTTDGASSTITKARLFQTTLIKQQIEAVTKVEIEARKTEQLLQVKKNKYKNK